MNVFDSVFLSYGLNRLYCDEQHTTRMDK